MRDWVVRAFQQVIICTSLNIRCFIFQNAFQCYFTGCELMDFVSREIIDTVFSNIQQWLVEPNAYTHSLDTDCLSLDHGCMNEAEKEKLKQQIDLLFHRVQYVDVTSEDSV